MSAPASDKGLAIDGEAEVGSFDLRARFDCATGSVTVVQGPNGSGKTTLLRVLAGLTGLVRGTLRLRGEPVDDPTAGVWVGPVERSVGFVPTDGVLFAHMSAVENVAYGLRRRGSPRTEARERALELLEALDAVGLAEQHPAGLSSGETQRVALARALATSPQVLLLDEAFSAIDAESRPILRARVLDELRPESSTVVFVTHDATEAVASADQLLSINAGSIAD